jgi:hypothetical protein
MQAPAAAQEIAPRLVLLSSGIGTIRHDRPFQLAARRAAGVDLIPCQLPTASHAAALTHDTSSRELTSEFAALGEPATRQIPPSHRSASVRPTPSVPT